MLIHLSPVQVMAMIAFLCRNRPSFSWERLVAGTQQFMLPTGAYVHCERIPRTHTGEPQWTIACHSQLEQWNTALWLRDSGVTKLAHQALLTKSYARLGLTDLTP